MTPSKYELICEIAELKEKLQLSAYSEIDNFIIYYTGDEKERKSMRKVLEAYVEEVLLQWYLEKKKC